MIDIKDVVRDLQQHRSALAREIKTLKCLLEPQGSGNLHTTISVLDWRVGKLDAEIVELRGPDHG
jgi:hypothetical protein